MMNNDNKHIESLVDLFMQGETSLEQEQELSMFFANSHDIPEEWEPYKEMMAYFDKGMPIEKPQSKKWNIASHVWIGTAAAVAAICIVVATHQQGIPQEKIPKEHITATDETAKSQNPEAKPLPSATALAQEESQNTRELPQEPVKARYTKLTVPAAKSQSVDTQDIEREQGEIEQAQQELMADIYIIEQERQELLDEQYYSRAQAYQAQQALLNEKPQFINVVFK